VKEGVRKKVILKTKLLRSWVIVLLVSIILGLSLRMNQKNQTAGVIPEREARENCRLLGIITRLPVPLSYIGNILDQFKSPRYPQMSGWSLAAFSDITSGGKLSMPGYPMIIRSEMEVGEDESVYDSVTQLVLRLKPNVVIGHLRNASSGCTDVADPHPFQKEINGKQFLFIHNGGVWGQDLEVLVNDLLKGEAIPLSCPETPIDSEYLFLYLLKIMQDEAPDPYYACQIWARSLLAHLTNQWNGLNIILTDGETLWGVRCSYQSSSFLLHYNELGESTAFSISTEALDYGWTLMRNNTVIELKPGFHPRIEQIPEPPEVTPAAPIEASVLQVNP
jgi:predicted glutamine amidotransferase